MKIVALVLAGGKVKEWMEIIKLSYNIKIRVLLKI